MSAPVMLATHEWPPVGTDAGAAAPVAVLVHGIAGWWRTWWRVGPALADRGWRVIAIDQRGHGESPPIDGIATAESLAADLAATMEGLGVAPVDLLVGHSLGAAVCMELVGGRPEVARRLVAEDPSGQDRMKDFDYQANLRAGGRAPRDRTRNRRCAASWPKTPPGSRRTLARTSRAGQPAMSRGSSPRCGAGPGFG